MIYLESDGSVLEQSRESKEYCMLTVKEKATLILKAIKLITKITQFAREGLSKEEREELVKDLQEFAMLVAKDAID
jgi:hypothetical protein